MTLTQALAKFILSVKLDQLSERTVETMKLVVMDAVGCGMYGLTTDWGQKVLSFTKDRPASDETSVWGLGEKRSAMDAALEMGVLIHAFDYDDYHFAKVHPGSVVIPAALSVGQMIGATGRDILEAILAGYEVMIRVSLATGPGPSRLKGWHLTGTTGTFGAAAAAGKLLGLNEEQLVSALGLAGTQSAGVWAFNADGAMSKRFHPGRSAQSGIVAALLAKKGFTGPSYILEYEDGGFFRATSDQYDESQLLKDIGEVYHSDDICFKPYSCCGSLHSSIDATKEIMAREGLKPADVATIRLLNSEVVRVQTGWEYVPSTILNAQMSMRYCVAVAALFGDVMVDQFTPEKIKDPAILAMVEKIRYIVDPEIDQIYPKKFSAKVEIDTVDGQTHRAYVEYPKGSSHNPMSVEDIQKKFRTSCSFALSDKDIDACIQMIMEFDRLDDINHLQQILSNSEVRG